jgi:membrane fusion protein, multidrug efflux system
MKQTISFLRTTLLLSVVLFFQGCSEKPMKVERSAPVTIGDIIQKDIPIYIESIGNVYSLQTVQIRPQVGGIILEAYVKQGQYVKKGAPLYKIDPRPYVAALERAEATLIKDIALLRYSEEQLLRNSELVKEDFISKLTYEQYVSQVGFNKGQVLSDEADIAEAKLNVEWCIPVSPLDGKISQYDIDVGNLVVANDANALTNIRQITPIDIRFNITQNEYVEVQNAMKNGELQFEVILPQKAEIPRVGNIYFIDNHLDMDTGTILLKGQVENDDELLWPGEFIKVRLQLRKVQNALLVPEEAVKIGQDGPYIYVYQPETSTAEYRPVVKGQKVDNRIYIQQGVKLGEKVIVQGQNNLLPGAKVFIPGIDLEDVQEKK